MIHSKLQAYFVYEEWGSPLPTSSAPQHPTNVRPNVTFIVILFLYLCRPFRNLEEINLSRNKLTDITNIGLDDLPRLKVLDVSFNNIGGTLKSVRQDYNLVKAEQYFHLPFTSVVGQLFGQTRNAGVHRYSWQPGR